MQIKIRTFLGRRDINHMMNACDLADGGSKIFGSQQTIVIEHETGELKQDAFYALVLQLHENFNVGYMICEQYQWVNPAYDMYSNGTKWGLLPKELEDVAKESRTIEELKQLLSGPGPVLWEACGRC